MRFGLFIVGFVVLGLGVWMLRVKPANQNSGTQSELSKTTTRLTITNPTTTNPTTIVPNPVGTTTVKTTGCYTTNFKHQRLKGHSNRESCGRHKNIIPLAELRARGDLNGICVRVDGTPVKFMREKSLLVVGPVAGPDSIVSVQYCVGKSTCTGECSVHEDSFMSAIGVVAGDAEEEARWDPSDKNSDSDVTLALDGELKRELNDEVELSAFKGWLQISESSGCSMVVTVSG
jgi:hypothetical protein